MKRSKGITHARVLAAMLLATTGSATVGLAQQPHPVAAECSRADVVRGAALPCATVAAIDSVAQSVIGAGKSPGLGVAVMLGGRLLLDRGYGKANLELDAPVTPLTVFRIFSSTKTFTASAVMQLAESGRLSLDDKLAKYFPEFPRGGEVTVRQLLSHTSGIRDYARPGVPDKQPMTPDQIVQLIETQTPSFVFEPGTKYSYSNANFALLARIVEKVSGEEYGRYLAQHVIAPASVASTAVDHNEDVVIGRAAGYRPNAAAPSRFVNGPYIDIGFPFGAGTIRSNAADLATWFSTFLAGRVVSAASVREMTTPARLTDGRLAGDVVLGREDKPGTSGYYGLGVEIGTLRGHAWVGHGGAFYSFSSAMRSYRDDDLTIVVLANAGGVADDAERRIASLLLQ